MTREDIPRFLPAILGVLRQDRAEGALSLEQNDGRRNIYWVGGDLVFLQSDVAGEQFGNYLLRQGILDLPALNEILAEGERTRLGERVVQAGLMTLAERDAHLGILQEQIMIHALEHPVLEMRWEPGPIGSRIRSDLQFKVDHTEFIWRTFQEARNLGDICDLLFAETSWKWEAPRDLLAALSDLPLNPKWAYALSFLGAEPIGFETFISLGGLAEEDAARLIVTLWALGTLTLSRGDIPSVARGPWMSRTSASRAPSVPMIQVTPPSIPFPEPVRPLTPPPESRPLTISAPTVPSPVVPAPVVAPPMPMAPISIALDVPARRVEAAAPEDLMREAAERLEALNTATSPSPCAGETSGPSEGGADSIKKARCLFKKGEALALQDRVSEAIRMLEQSIQLDPDSDKSYEAWLLLGKLRLGNPAWSTRAIEALQKASRIHPVAGEPWALMGDLYLRKGFQTNAMACYKKALELDPSVPVPMELNLRGEEDAGREGSGLLGRLGNGIKSILGRKESDG